MSSASHALSLSLLQRFSELNNAIELTRNKREAVGKRIQATQRRMAAIEQDKVQLHLATEEQTAKYADKIDTAWAAESAPRDDATIDSTPSMQTSLELRHARAKRKHDNAHNQILHDHQSFMAQTRQFRAHAWQRQWRAAKLLASQRRDGDASMIIAWAAHALARGDDDANVVERGVEQAQQLQQHDMDELDDDPENWIVPSTCGPSFSEGTPGDLEALRQLMEQYRQRKEALQAARTGVTRLQREVNAEHAKFEQHQEEPHKLQTQLKRLQKSNAKLQRHIDEAKDGIGETRALAQCYSDRLKTTQVATTSSNQSYQERSATTTAPETTTTTNPYSRNSTAPIYGRSNVSNAQHYTGAATASEMSSGAAVLSSLRDIAIGRTAPVQRDGGNQNGRKQYRGGGIGDRRRGGTLNQFNTGIDVPGEPSVASSSATLVTPTAVPNQEAVMQAPFGNQNHEHDSEAEFSE